MRADWTEAYENELIHLNAQSKRKDDQVDMPDYAARVLYENQSEAVNRSRVVHTRRWLA